MIETYAFLAAFAVQIVVVSVLHPVWVTRYARAKAEVQPLGVQPATRERFLTVYRAVNMVVGLLGVALLAWLLIRMQRPDWDVPSVLKPFAFYSMGQLSPFVVAGLIAMWIKKRARLRVPSAAKRTASLERRGLFDIVSPFTVLLAGLAYVLFAGLILTIQQHPVPGFAGYVLLRTVTAVYVLNAFLVYWLLYRRKKWPLETHAYRMQAVAVQVKMTFYVTIFVTAFVSLTAALRLLHLLRWMPFAVSDYFVIVALFTAWFLFSLRRQAEADRLNSSPSS
ncbi:MAG TPA: hypothetical protein VMU01_01795 [Rhizomicrobium sp.]|nr:hypothetical protein [Rhizomicrobium sp.]